MNKYVLSIGLILFLILTAKAWELRDNSEELNYCEWLGNAAYTVAKNRDIGVEENVLIGEYLNQSDNYTEQALVINLIDQIYGALKNKNADDLKLETKSFCLETIFSLHTNN